MSQLKGHLRFLIFLIVFNFSSGVSTSQEIKSVVKHPEWSRNSVIYEVNVRQFSKDGTFKAVEEYMSKFKELGVEILWLMPINPIGEKNRKGTLGSYYSVKDYTAVNPEFGTMQDFKRFVKQAHKHGLKVIIDWVANHTSWDNVWTQTHPEFFTKDSSGNFIPSVPDWTDVIDLNFDNKELWTYMIDALKFWVKEADIDGYRCDVASMVPMEFWNKARVELDKIKPVFMLAEAEGPQFHEKAFDMTYAWDFHHLMNDIAKGSKTAADLKSYFIKDNEKYPDDAYRMLFITNHDENSWKGTEFERLSEGTKAFAVLTATAEGMPLIYTGQEIGLNKRLSFFEKDPVEWTEDGFRNFYTTLSKLKEKNKVLLNGKEGAEMEIISDSSNIFSFVREKGNNKIFVVLNLSSKEQNYNFDNQKVKGNYKELFTGEVMKLNNKGNFILKPWDYKVFVK